MAKLRIRRRLMNEINVVPYIDVMLVLLIIFMITAPMINQGEIELPQIGQSSEPPMAPLEIMIATDGSLTIQDRARIGESQKIGRNQLSAFIAQKQQQDPEQPVVIAADKDVRYEEVINVMDTLQQLQVKKIGLLASQK